MAVAQNYEVQFGVSLTPAINLSVDEGAATKVMDTEVKKSLGGSGTVGGVDGLTVAASGSDVTGYTAGAASYLESYNSGNGQDFAGVSPGAVFVKNTGFEYSAGKLGDALVKTDSNNPYDSTDGWAATDAIKVIAKKTSAPSDEDNVIAVLYPGEAMVLPRLPAATTINVSSNSGTTSIAIEYAVIS